MNKQLIVIFLVALLGGGIGCMFGMKSTAKNTCPRCCADNGENWLRTELITTTEQNAKLDKIESAFSSQEEKLQAALDSANRRLGETIIAERAFTPEVEKSIEMIHHAMANLQKASIEHIFKMEEVLQPKQFEKLLKITGETLGK